mmetsp:Transcript_30127/g.68023  ORF Transcript_30127/g.68023 Transcript_30127/m.68023 type:complete len:249 (-) Transcript_30127:1575-2321(-)
MRVTSSTSSLHRPPITTSHRPHTSPPHNATHLHPTPPRHASIWQIADGMNANLHGRHPITHHSSSNLGLVTASARAGVKRRLDPSVERIKRQLDPGTKNRIKKRGRGQCNLIARTIPHSSHGYEQILRADPSSRSHEQTRRFWAAAREQIPTRDPKCRSDGTEAMGAHSEQTHAALVVCHAQRGAGLSAKGGRWSKRPLGLDRWNPGGGTRHSRQIFNVDVDVDGVVGCRARSSQLWDLGAALGLGYL